MAINIILALLTTRYALKALGINDFGLFSVLGSIISFIGVFNTIMVSTSNRFLAVAIGKGDTTLVNKQFNVNLLIYMFIVALIIIISFPIGNWYIQHCMNYEGMKSDAMMVFSFSIIGSVISILATPYNGLLMAKEKFIVFGCAEVLVHIIRFVVSLLLVNYFDNKLYIYAATMAITSALPTLIYWVYCHYNYREYVKWKVVKEKEMYKKVFSFSGWVGVGAVACVARNQGSALIINTFFSTIMNTALGIANSLNSYVIMFANNLTQPMQPQITKCYSAGNFLRANELLIMSTKFSFILMLFISTPFFVNAEWLLSLWLGDVPPYAVSFTVLLIIDNLIQSFNSGISTILFASGKISLYQIMINSLRIVSIILGYIILKVGGSCFSLFYIYILFSVISTFVTQWCLRKTLNYNTKELFRQAYFPSAIIVLLLLPIMLLPSLGHPVINIVVSQIYLSLLIYTIGLNRKEKAMFMSKLMSKKYL